MPVNTAALKTFAPAMRRQLIEAVGRKLDRLLHQASADTLTTAAGPIEELRQQEATNRPELLERVLPLHEVIPVDLYLPGCPPSAERIRAAIAPLLLGQRPRMEGPEMLRFG